jgi:heme/copper-type cytochrome/quinol oxidase subunit 2
MYNSRTTARRLARGALLSLAVTFLSVQTAYAQTTRDPKGDIKNNPIVRDINVLVNVLIAGVGVVIVIMLVWSGIRYTTAGDDPQKVASAKGHIFNAIVALVAFIFLFAVLQWLVPGGIV